MTDIPVIELQPSTFTITFCNEIYSYYERTDALDIIYNNPYLFKEGEEESEPLPHGFDSVDELTTFLQEWPKYEYKFDPFKNPNIKQDQWIQVKIKIIDKDHNDHETYLNPFYMWYFFTQKDPNWNYITKSFDKSKNVPQDLMFHGCSFTSDPSIAQGINIGKCKVPSDFYREGAFYTTNYPNIALDYAISVTKNKRFQYPSVIIYPNIHKQYQENPDIVLSFPKLDNDDDDDDLLGKYTCHDFGETPNLEWKQQISFCKEYNNSKKLPKLPKSSRYGWIAGLISETALETIPIQYGFRSLRVIKYLDLLCLGAVIINKVK